jgi:cell division protein FtsA
VAHTARFRSAGSTLPTIWPLACKMPVAQAEELKRQYGNAVVTAVPLDAEIEIANPSRRCCACA